MWQAIRIPQILWFTYPRLWFFRHPRGNTLSRNNNNTHTPNCDILKHPIRLYSELEYLIGRLEEKKKTSRHQDLTTFTIRSWHFLDSITEDETILYQVNIRASWSILRPLMWETILLFTLLMIHLTVSQYCLINCTLTRFTFLCMRKYEINDTVGAWGVGSGYWRRTYCVAHHTSWKWVCTILSLMSYDWWCIQ